MWSWIYCKEKNRTEEIARKNPDAGDVWLWTAIDADSKLVPSWMLGQRDLATAKEFVADLASRLSKRVQITSDSHRPYLQAIEDEFGDDVDYAQLQNIYGAPSDEDQRRYSPAKCIGCDMKVVSGDPDPKHVSTSYVERQNLTMRMHMRRFTRLTNAFSKKAANHRHSVALHYMFYNFCRVHQTLKIKPAMEAVLTDHVWSLDELCALMPKPVVRASNIEKSLGLKALKQQERA